jgi:protein arginine kinase activator
MFADGSGWELETGGSPLCESCGSEQAVVHLVQIQDGAIAHTHLCQRCAQQAAEHGPASMAVVFAMPAALTGLFGNVLATEKGRPTPPPTLDDPVCYVCGTTLEQVTESGQLGCAACYGVFAAQVEQAMTSAHDTSVYQGKLPRNLPQELDGQREVVRLRRMLSELVDNELFEEAASVRDRLAELAAGVVGDRATTPGGLRAEDEWATGE